MKLTLDGKKEKLKALAKEMRMDTTLPLRKGATNLVFGEGNPDTNIYFIGEAPGFNEDKMGRPFIGRAGMLLDKLMREIGLERKDVYISNIVRFRPPENRDPEPEEIAAFQPYVDREIEIIDPKIIVTLGRFSMGKFIPGMKITGIHGTPRSIMWKDKEVILIPMYHPAAALRATAIMQQLQEDFKVIIRVLNEIKERERIQEEERIKPKQENLF